MWGTTWRWVVLYKPMKIYREKNEPIKRAERHGKKHCDAEYVF